ncbi:Acyl-CoA N-acyltransferase [Akanthomyces lecanii RCEF 1005]|uniref:Acyl-CoA N-acyltransferase n=1 Tax=Akanthomyces lecanii RCEF 1005 TaxID=1081108 RepID=A0A162JW22_CORDF|nr:Acyl-CoA N-acyltransferase [Akanthomyces lecanii RCEF 1005]
MSLYLAPASEADADRFAAIEHAALPDDATTAALFPGPFASDGGPSRGDQLREHLRSDPDCRWVKVVDRALEEAPGARPGDATVAFAVWYFWDKQGKPLPASVWGPGTNAAACELYFGGLDKRWEDDVGSKPHAYLKFVHTDPKHQRRGAGRMMMDWGTKEADDKGLVSYVQASPEGRGLYAKYGFQLVDIFAVDLSPWGGPARDETAIMIRPVGAAHA